MSSTLPKEVACIKSIEKFCKNNLSKGSVKLFVDHLCDIIIPQNPAFFENNLHIKRLMALENKSLNTEQLRVGLLTEVRGLMNDLNTQKLPVSMMTNAVDEIFLPTQKSAKKSVSFKEKLEEVKYFIKGEPIQTNKQNKGYSEEKSSEHTDDDPPLQRRKSMR